MDLDSRQEHRDQSKQHGDLEKQQETFKEVERGSGSITPPEVEQDGKLNFATIMAVYVPGLC